MPKYAVISCGKDNSYGHPTSGTLNKLKNANISVYRTDLAGTITFTSDGSTITVDKTANFGSAGDVDTTTTPKVTTTTTRQQTAANSQSVTVYITNTGSKYHCAGCRYLSKSKIAISLEDAKKSYNPCSLCNPPE